MEKLHKGTKWLFRFEGWIVGIFIAGFITGFLSSVVGFNIILLIVFIVFTVILGEIFSSFIYNNWGYEFTQRELKIQKGVIAKTYKSIPYERIQNVDINRGILARICGYSTLDIQTAGYSGYHYRGRGRVMSEGHIPGVSVEAAEHIRDFIMNKIVGNKEQGV